MRVRLLCIMAVLAVAAAGQLAPSRWSSFKTLPHGDLDRSNLNLHLEFPIYTRNTGTRAQLAGYLAYDGLIWSNDGVSWEPNPSSGWHFEANTGARVEESRETNACGDDGARGAGPDIIYGTYTVITFTFIAPDGTTADVGNFETHSGSGCPPDILGSTTTVVQASRDTYTVTTYSGGESTAYDSEGDNVDNEFADPSGNAVTGSTSGGTTTYTDPLGTVLSVSGSEPGTVSYTYTGPKGAAQITATYASINVSADFGCGYTPYTGTLDVVTALSYPGVGTYTFGYDSDGFLESIGLPTGGTISYTMQQGCQAMTVDRSESVDSGKPWQWSWVNNNDGTTSTTETDPDGNVSDYTFTGGILSEVDRDQGSTAVSATTIATTEVSGTVTGQTATTELYGSTPLYATHYAAYNNYGKVVGTDTTDWGTSSPGGPLLRQTAANWTLTGADDQETSLTVYGATNAIEAQTGWTYNGSDEVSSMTRQVTGSAALTTNYSYNTNGTPASVTAPNGGVTTYGNYACGSGLFPGTIQSPVAVVKTTLAWNCSGGVLTSSTDGNNATTSYTYLDPANAWRPSAVTDAAGDVTTLTYTPDTTESRMLFNGGNSIAETLTTLDALGRAAIVQHETGPGTGTYDSVETTYDALGRPHQVSEPYTAGAGGETSGPWASTTSYDAYSRPLTVIGADGDEVAHTYTQNDDLVTVGPSGGAALESRQDQFDGLGELESVCEITTATGSGACGQTEAASGFLTGYARNSYGEITQVAQSSETRSFTYDELGRLTEAVTPEAGTTAYDYGASPDGCAAQTGNLAERKD
ncbi:MAG: RHS repeat domain-containing protein, partial [Terriglobales bacterium]